MSSPYLPDDCIYYILKYLQPYHSTLFNCLLVNRFWCKATVPLLYTDPFIYSNNKNRSSIIFTLISCFNKTEILQLKNQLKLKNINNININDEHKPLFEYLKYLENFDYFKINTTILSWLNLSHQYSFFDPDESKNVIPILYQSMLLQCNNIKQLNIPLYVLYNCNVQTIKTITLNLEKLNSLVVSLNLSKKTYETDNKTSAGFLNNIGNICLNLRKFEISSRSMFASNYSIDDNASDFRENLCTIIQKQNNLKIIKLSSYCQNFLNNIFLSLEFQKHSLVGIEFSCINFSNISFKNFINLHNLKYLKFCNCNNVVRFNHNTIVSLDKYEILKYVSFKLKQLEFIFSNSSLIESLMIKYLGASLQELKLEKLDVSIIENVSTYCLNLTTLEIVINQNDVDLLFLSHFKHLKVRILNICVFNFVDYGMVDMNVDIFKNLAINLPINVKEVYFFYNLLHFKEFFENCHNFLEIIGINCFIELILLEMILDYIGRSSSDNYLKYLGIKLEKKLDGEESKLLDQIKSKGVKIVDFYSICKPVGISQE